MTRTCWRVQLPDRGREPTLLGETGRHAGGTQGHATAPVIDDEHLYFGFADELLRLDR